MKTKTLIITVAILVSTIAILYFQFEPYTFIDRMIKTNAHIENYKLISKVHDDQQWYVSIIISKSDGERLFKLYRFQYGSNPIYSAGKYRNPYIMNDANQWYYFTDEKQGPYGYTLYRLNMDKTKLEIYNLFAN